MFLTPEQINGMTKEIIQEEVARQTEDERIHLLYASLCQELPKFEALGFSSETITMVAGAIYYDRRSRLPKDFPTSHDLQRLFAELDEDATTQTLLDWTAKNVNRLSRLVLEHPATRQTLKGLMLAKGLALRDRNPVILRHVIQLAIAEYLSRGYDPARLEALIAGIQDTMTHERKSAV